MKLRWRLLGKILLLLAVITLAEVWRVIDEPAPELLARLRPLLRFVSILLTLNVILGVFGVFYRRHQQLRQNEDDTILLGLRNVYYILTGFVVFAGVIALYGLDLRTVFTTLSIIAAAIAIVTRDVINEVLTGLIMSFARQISVGDYISLGQDNASHTNIKGRIETLTLTKVVLISEDQDLILVPNSKVFSGELVNYTRRMKRRLNISFEVALTGIDTVDNFEASLIEALEPFSELIVPGSHSLRVVGLHKDYAEFKFRYELRGSRETTESDIRRRTSRAVINYIKSRGPMAADHLRQSSIATES